MGPLGTVSGAALIYVAYHVFKAWHKKRSATFPPGPKGLPLVGNLFDMPTEKHWLKFTEWASEFGDVVYLDIPGSPIVILNSLKATGELMERRSANTSDRPCTLFEHFLRSTPDGLPKIAT